MACNNHPDSTTCPLQLAYSAIESIAEAKTDIAARTIAIEAMRQMVNHPLATTKPRLDLTESAD